MTLHVFVKQLFWKTLFQEFTFEDREVKGKDSNLIQRGTSFIRKSIRDFRTK